MKKKSGLESGVEERLAKYRDLLGRGGIADVKMFYGANSAPNYAGISEPSEELLKATEIFSKNLKNE